MLIIPSVPTTSTRTRLLPSCRHKGAKTGAVRTLYAAASPKRRRAASAGCAIAAIRAAGRLRTTRGTMYYPQQQQYRVYYNKNAYYPYGAVDIDHGDTAPALSAQECKDRCSERADCMCVTQETSTGMCWMRAECDPAGWRSPNNDGYNVFMKV
eukprot:TRINITY_DN3678_c0_g1_i6.p2 TRINITY_DN3678_c0_g1~~TRINITY_DN3678_c0_g1_i6.p2  ORF type:complete len:154 (+),score=15.96 TRINITY_DN3678_c0_g1_i6:423-884(+)